MSNLTIIMALIALGMGTFTVQLMRKRKIAVSAFMLWISVWGGMLLISLFPDILIWLASVANMQLRAYFVFVVAIVFIIFLLFFRSVTERREEYGIAVLTQELALLKFKLEQMEHERKE